MGVEVTSAILASIVSLTIAIAVLARQPRRPLYRYFSAFALALFAWHAAFVAEVLSGLHLPHLQLFASLLLPPIVTLFFRELLREQSSESPRLKRMTWVISAVLIIFGMTPLADDLAHATISAAYRTIATSYIYGTLVFTLHGLYRRTRTARPDDKKRLRLLFYGGLITLIFATGKLVQDSELLAAGGHITATFYVYFLYQSILARRLVDLVELLGKAAVLAVLTLVLATVYALLVLWVGSHQQSLWLFNTLVASFVILILYDQFRPWVEDTTTKLLFRERYELRQLLRRLLRALRTITTLPEMTALVLDTLSATDRATQLAVYLQDEGGAAYNLHGYRGREPAPLLSIQNHPILLADLRRERKPVLLENLLLRKQDLPFDFTADNLTLQHKNERLDEAISLMRQLGANAVIPMVIDDRILGLIAIGSTRAAESYSTDELAAFLSVAEACAVVIENSQEYDKRRERDRLVAIGEMAAGMAHEIRNPLGAIKGAAQCLEPSAVPGESQELVDVIIEEVDRLNRVVSAFLEYARPFCGDPVAIDINTIVTSTLKLMTKSAVPEGVVIAKELATALPLVMIDPEQLKQVLLNLVLNAAQAMPEGGVVTITTAHGLDRRASYDDTGAPSFADTTQVILRVRDNGPGITAENLQRIFVPFFTTKPSGTGLGLAISQRIIETAGGRIEVTSKYEAGSTFTVRLPAIGESPTDDRRG